MCNDHKKRRQQPEMKILSPQEKNTPSATVELLGISVYYSVMMMDLVWDATFDDAAAN